MFVLTESSHQDAWRLIRSRQLSCSRHSEIAVIAQSAFWSQMQKWIQVEQFLNNILDSSVVEVSQFNKNWNLFAWIAKSSLMHEKCIAYVICRQVITWLQFCPHSWAHISKMIVFSTFSSSFHEWSLWFFQYYNCTWKISNLLRRDVIIIPM